MGCNCKVLETVLAILILVFYFWETVISGWVIVIAAIVLLVHSFMCKNCKIDNGASRSAKKRK